MGVYLYQEDCFQFMAHTDQRFNMIFADIPYGITQNKWDVKWDLGKMFELFHKILYDDGVIVMTATQPFASELIMANKKNFRYDWIWEKALASGHLNAKWRPMRAHESILIFYKKKPIYNPQFLVGKPYQMTNSSNSSNQGRQLPRYTTKSDGRRYPRTVIKIWNDAMDAAKRENRKRHPTEKPIELLEYLIKTYTDEGYKVFDPCVGSGTTLVACKNLNRNGVGCELDNAYFEMARNRVFGIRLDENKVDESDES